MPGLALVAGEGDPARTVNAAGVLDKVWLPRPGGLLEAIKK
jgi:hypothetical protein